MQFQQFVKKNPNEPGKHWKFADKAPTLDRNTDFNDRISELGLKLQFLGGLTGTSRAESGESYFLLIIIFQADTLYIWMFWFLDKYQ